jgi:hypothetical protein
MACKALGRALEHRAHVDAAGQEIELQAEEAQAIRRYETMPVHRSKSVDLVSAIYSSLRDNVDDAPRLPGDGLKEKEAEEAGGQTNKLKIQRPKP